jgi:hypothetical protein
MTGGALIPTPDVRIIGPTFTQWLESPDSATSKQQSSVRVRRATPRGHLLTGVGRFPNLVGGPAGPATHGWYARARECNPWPVENETCADDRPKALSGSTAKSPS